MKRKSVALLNFYTVFVYSLNASYRFYDALICQLLQDLRPSTIFAYLFRGILCMEALAPFLADLSQIN